MDMIIKTEHLSFPTKVAIGCFLIGTFLFSFNQLFPNDIVVFLGFYFVVFAIPFNTTILLYLLIQLLLKPMERQANLIRILIVLSNIPIALFYFTITVNH